MTISIRLELPRQPGVIRLLEMSDAYAASLYPAESNHMLDLASLEEDNVSFLVARRGDAVLGCASLVEADDGTAEIKRMFVDPEARGLKFGRRLLEALEQRAKEKAVSILRLETGIYQPEALGLYRSFGYRDIGPFGTYKADPLSIFMGKHLA